MTGQQANFRSRRRASVVGASLVLASAIVVFALVWQRYGHTQWHHYVGPKNPNCFGLALVLDYPDGWQAVVDPHMPNDILLKPIPLAGPARWWHDYILRQRDSNNAELRVDCMMASVSDMMGTDTPSRIFTQTGYVSSLRYVFGEPATRRFEHPLGPALEMISTIGPTPARLRRAPKLTRFVRRSLMIFLPERPAGSDVLITVTADIPQDAYPRSRETLDAIFQRIRIVKDR